jgi:hypothetical protein
MQLLYPLTVEYIGFATGCILEMACIDEADLEPLAFEQLV